MIPETTGLAVDKVTDSRVHTRFSEPVAPYEYDTLYDFWGNRGLFGCLRPPRVYA